MTLADGALAGTVACGAVVWASTGAAANRSAAPAASVKRIM